MIDNDSILPLKLFEAYYRARKNKRNTWNQLKFEFDFEHKLFQLAEEIKRRRYKPGPWGKIGDRPRLNFNQVF